jgi:nucleoid DNA-binding protein
MNKDNLVKNAAAKIEGATQKDIGVAVDVIFDTIKESIIAGESVKISGFGTFEPVERAARSVRNPQTKEMMTVPASKSIKFKPSSVFKGVLNA